MVASADVTNNATVGGTVSETTVDVFSAGSSSITSAAIAGDATVGGTLGVAGTSTLGVVNAGASTLASAAVTGSATIGTFSIRILLLDSLVLQHLVLR